MAALIKVQEERIVRERIEKENDALLGSDSTPARPVPPATWMNDYYVHFFPFRYSLLSFAISHSLNLA